MAFTQLLLTIPVFLIEYLSCLGPLTVFQIWFTDCRRLQCLRRLNLCIYRLIGGLSSGNMATLEHFQHQLYFKGAA